MPLLLLILLAYSLTAGPAWSQATKPLPALKAAAPAAVPAPKIYTYVEQMPELPGGGGNAAIVTYIGRHTHIPPFCGSEPLATRIVVEFIVSETGDVRAIKVVKSLDRRVDAAVVAAISSMPCWQPGRQHGQPVSVKFMIPIGFDWQR